MLDQTVQATSGSPPAVTRSTPDGIGSSCAAGTATFSAYPPPASSAHTSSPTDQPVTPSPSAAIRPEHSSPMISDAPGGGGYWPWRCSRSARLTALATTSSTTSPGPASGSGTWAHSSTSGPPGSRTVIAYMVRDASAMTRPEHWPLRHLVLRTPRLELRPDDDPGLFELVEVAYRGVHPPEEMPFATPWTDADPAYLGRGACSTSGRSAPSWPRTGGRCTSWSASTGTWSACRA